MFFLADDLDILDIWGDDDLDLDGGLGDEEFDTRIDGLEDVEEDEFNLFY